jgi:CDP-diacylglycerol---serine O-phosphatidyltransferase
VPRAPWRRRRTTDSPRPKGRLTGRLRRGGSFARQVLLVRVGRRRGAAGDQVLADPRAALDIDTHPDLTGPHGLGVDFLAPASPAVPMLAGEPAPRSMAIPLLPGERTPARRAKFALVQACTLAGLTLGVVAIFLAMTGHVDAAAGCLVAYAACDGVDGALARRLGVASPFGAQMDSLVDMSSTGIAAPIVVYAYLAGSVPVAAAALTAALVAGGAAIRLARFNVSPKDGRFFCGVPTTIAAAMLAVTVLLGVSLPGAAMLVGVALLAFAMVSSFPYAKLARIAKLPAWLWIVPVVTGFFNIQLTFAVLVVIYLLSGPVLWVRQRAR